MPALSFVRPLGLVDWCGRVHRRLIVLGLLIQAAHAPVDYFLASRHHLAGDRFGVARSICVDGMVASRRRIPMGISVTNYEWSAIVIWCFLLFTAASISASQTFTHAGISRAAFDVECGCIFALLTLLSETWSIPPACCTRPAGPSDAVPRMPLGNERALWRAPPACTPRWADCGSDLYRAVSRRLMLGAYDSIGAFSGAGGCMPCDRRNPAAICERLACWPGYCSNSTVGFIFGARSNHRARIVVAKSTIMPAGRTLAGL